MREIDRKRELHNQERERERDRIETKKSRRMKARAKRNAFSNILERKRPRNLSRFVKKQLFILLLQTVHSFRWFHATKPLPKCCSNEVKMRELGI